MEIGITIKTLRAYRLVASKRNPKSTKQVKDSLELYRFLVDEIYDKDSLDVTESFYALFLDQSNSLKGYIKVSDGGITNCIADPKIVFGAALKCLATCIVLSHNHPSGNPRPSEEDRKLTKKFSQAANLLDIVLLDHIVVGSDRYYSFREHGELVY